MSFVNSSTLSPACERIDFSVLGARIEPECTGTVTMQSFSSWYRKLAAFYVHEFKACPLQGFDHFFSGYPG
jgi:hypothetical protein